jgi:hypothetical protein
LPLCFPAFYIPRYTKIHGWDKSNVHVKKLGNLLTCKKEREANETNIYESFSRRNSADILRAKKS